MLKNCYRYSALVSLTMLVASGAELGPSQASANAPVTAGGNTNDFVAAAAPIWYFARAVGHDACFPASPLTNAGQHPPAPRKNWPDAGSGCPGPGSAFPVYVAYKTCFDTEVRVAYVLYFPKDGFADDLFHSGHDHDFEYVIVTWKYNGNNQWVRDRLMMSAHGDRHGGPWAKIQTKDFNNNSGMAQERPRIYVGWGKHAMFNNEGGLTDIASQNKPSFPLEYRHGDYEVADYQRVRVTDTSALGEEFKRYNWGSATSNPANVYHDLCSLEITR